MSRHHTYIARKAVSLLCSFALLMGQVPTTALAEAVEEQAAAAVEQVAEPAAEAAAEAAEEGTSEEAEAESEAAAEEAQAEEPATVEEEAAPETEATEEAEATGTEQEAVADTVEATDATETAEEETTEADVASEADVAEPVDEQSDNAAAADEAEDTEAEDTGDEAEEEEPLFDVQCGDQSASFANLGEAIDWACKAGGDVTISLRTSYEVTDEDLRDVTLAAGQTLAILGNDETLWRAEGTKGTLLVVKGAGCLQLEGLCLDGADEQGAAPIVRMEGETQLVLVDTQVAGHAAEHEGVCAIDAAGSTGSVLVSGTTSVAGNVANGAPANLAVSGSDRLVVADDLASAGIGITSDACAEGEQFGILAAAGATGYACLSCDADATLVAAVAEDGQGIVWADGDADASSNGEADAEATAEETAKSQDVVTPAVAPVRKAKALAKASAAVKSVTVKVPLTKVLTSNEGLLETRLELAEETFAFDLACDKAEGASIALTSGKAGTLFELPASTVIDEGTKNGNTATYTAEGDASPWTVTFTKEGTYTFTLSEVANEEVREYDMTYGTSYTLTYHVVEEEGVLRVAESYKSANYAAQPTPEGPTQESITVGNLFYVSSKVDGSYHGQEVPAKVFEGDGSIKIYMHRETVSAVTTQFSFDFSRSFVVMGEITIPREDGYGIAFHTNKQVEAQMTEGNFGFDANRMGTAYLMYGYTTPKTGLGNGYLFVMQNEPDSGYASYRMEGRTRTPFKATSGLSGKSYDSVSNVSHGLGEDVTSPYSITWTCDDPITGIGTLVLKVNGKTITYKNFDPQQMFGSSNWNEVFLSIGANVDHYPLEDFNTVKASFSIDSSRYLDGIASMPTTSFWADRDGNGSFETQVNTTDSPAIPGETIRVRHEIVPLEANKATIFENVLVTQLRDTTSGAKLVGANGVSYLKGDPSTAIAVNDFTSAAFNSYVLSDGMRVPVFAGSENTIFEYAIVAPQAKNHTVIESALFGQPPFPRFATESYGFRTENLQEQMARLTNQAKIYQSVRVHVSCATTGEAIADAQFAVYGQGGDPLWTGSSDASGDLAIKPTAKFKPRAGETFVLRQLTTDDAHLLPLGTWTLAVGADESISAEVTHAEGFDAEHPDWTLDAPVSAGVLQVKNQTFAQLTVSNQIEGRDASDVMPVVELADVLVGGQSLKGSAVSVYVREGERYVSLASYLQQTTGSSTGNAAVHPGEALSLVIPDRASGDAYCVKAGVLRYEDGEATQAEGSFTVSLSDSGVDASLTSANGKTSIEGGASAVTGSVEALSCKGSIVKGGSAVTFGGREMNPNPPAPTGVRTHDDATQVLAVGSVVAAGVAAAFARRRHEDEDESTDVEE